jgi:hypothetical protein
MRKNLKGQPLDDVSGQNVASIAQAYFQVGTFLTNAGHQAAYIGWLV